MCVYVVIRIWHVHGWQSQACTIQSRPRDIGKYMNTVLMKNKSHVPSNGLRHRITRIGCKHRPRSRTIQTHDRMNHAPHKWKTRCAPPVPSVPCIPPQNSTRTRGHSALIARPGPACCGLHVARAALTGGQWLPPCSQCRACRGHQHPRASARRHCSRCRCGRGRGRPSSSWPS